MYTLPFSSLKETLPCDKVIYIVEKPCVFDVIVSHVYVFFLNRPGEQPH